MASRFTPATAADFAHHLNAGEQAVLQVGEQLVAQLPCLGGEILALGIVDLQQADRGEVPHQLANLRMQRQAVEQRQVEAEGGLLAPALQGAGIGAEHHDGWGEAEGVGGFFQGAPLLRIELRRVALEAWHCGVFAAQGRWQLRCCGQFVDACEPVVTVALVAAAFEQAAFGQQVVAKADVQGGQAGFWIVQQLLQLIEQ